jgi:hypothetical protein
MRASRFSEEQITGNAVVLQEAGSSYRCYEDLSITCGTTFS